MYFMLLFHSSLHSNIFHFMAAEVACKFSSGVWQCGVVVYKLIVYKKKRVTGFLMLDFDTAQIMALSFLHADIIFFETVHSLGVLPVARHDISLMTSAVPILSVDPCQTSLKFYIQLPTHLILTTFACNLPI